VDISYRQFWSEFRKRRPVTKPVTIKLHHNPGEKAQVDFCDGISLVCKETGMTTKTHLFVAVLPFSAMPFAEFCLNQKLDSFIDLHQKAFVSFGGVPSYVVPDNLKSGVSKAHRYDPDTNPTYCDYANHAGFAVLPARPYSPKDKASVESHIGLIQRGFFTKVRNQIFHSLFDLNQELK
jgi:transposase